MTQSNDDFYKLFADQPKSVRQKISNQYPSLSDEICVLAYISFADKTVHQAFSRYIHDHYNRHYPPGVIKKIVKHLHIMTALGDDRLWGKLEKIKVKYEDDPDPLAFFMLESYAVIKSQESPSGLTLQHARNMAELFGISSKDEALIRHLFRIAPFSENKAGQGRLQMLKISAREEQADLFYPNALADINLIFSGSSYYIINNTDACEIFVNRFPVPAFTVEKIPHAAAISFEQQSLLFSDLPHLFANKANQHSLTLFVTVSDDLLNISEAPDDTAVITIRIQGNINRLIVNDPDCPVIINGRPVKAKECCVQFADALKIGDFIKFRLSELLVPPFKRQLQKQDDVPLWTMSTDDSTSLNHIILSVPDNIKIHLEIHAETSGPMLVNKSLDGPSVLINGHTVNFPYLLNEGDVIRVLDNYLTFSSKNNELAHYVPRFSSFGARDLIYTFKGGTKAINKVSFEVEAGKLVAIMGPSGCGKSTLLNILNGSAAPTSGKVLINGYDLHDNFSSVQSSISYSPQDDLLFSNLTVMENMVAGACIRNPDWDLAKIREKSLSVLADVDLMRVKDEMVGDVVKKNLSGGQRKRVNIGVELMTDPDLLFLDEPTSGLSSLDSEQIIRVLKHTAMVGKIIFVVIHQPSSAIFKMFDYLVLLDNGGKLVFFGTPQEGIAHFKAHKNLTGPIECPDCGSMMPEVVFDILEEKLQDKEGKPLEVEERGKKIPVRKYWPAYWRNHFKHYSGRFYDVTTVGKVKKDIPSPSPISAKNRLRQTWFILYRNFLDAIRDKSNLLTTLFAAPALSLFISFVLNTSGAGAKSAAYAAKDNIPTFLFLMVIVSVFLGLTCSAGQIIRDKKILVREKMLDTSILSYYFSKVVTLFTFSFVQNILFLLVAGFILNNLPFFWINLLFCMSSSLVGITLGLLLSSFNITVAAAYNIIPLILVPQIILGGAILQYEKMNRQLMFSCQSAELQENFEEGGSLNLVPSIAYCMPSYYAFEGVMVSSKTLHPYERYMSRFEQQLHYWNKLADAGEITEDEVLIKIEALRIGQEKFRQENPQTRYRNKAVYDAVYQGKSRFKRRLGMENRKKPLFFGTFLSPEKIVFGHFIPTPVYSLIALFMLSLLFGAVTLIRLRKKL